MLIRGFLFLFTLLLSNYGLSDIVDKYYSVAVDAGKLYEISPCIILAVLEQEGGVVGEDTSHPNGNIDSGIAQINVGGEWMNYFMKKYGIAHSQIRDNPLVSVMLVSYILRKELDRSGNDIIYMLSAYHAGYGKRKSLRGLKYSQSVLERVMKISQKGVICNV